jgi:hypothetical protein
VHRRHRSVFGWLKTLTEIPNGNLYKVHGIPALVLIGMDGTIKNYWEGEVSKPDLEAAIQQASRH